MNVIWDSQRIKQGRKDSGLTAAVAANRLNITPEYLSMLENGKGQPSQRLISNMAAIYSRPVVYFLRHDASICET